MFQSWLALIEKQLLAISDQVYVRHILHYREP